ncbi:tRNA (guanine-N(7)-)-methyltransferase non-catalytic subunit wdr4-like [Ctenocephalides felis]|uniref:tRNA (guanine-N(7)-)-methyltransferase non-catalytic subunit wdr4-like n=1 Tax=Ctenocephalides felis TaxID=7515 RepID=UPI000E6E5318|nr:tRNA (guanine-N(7)-)-methyltransferase non-catalytic subunit wdr4-like [Ctenocephalides felis]
MAVLELKRTNLLIGVNDTILIHNLAESTTTDIKIVQSNPKIKENICMVAFSKTCEYFAIVTDQKVLHIYFKTDSYDCIETYSMSRAASAMKFSENCNKLVIADKTGDVYLAEKKNKWHPKLILGHLSMLLDVLLTPDDKCIISCDRDEKIRVSAYPDTFNIVAYCLGHEEFVSSLDILTEHPDILFPHQVMLL